MQNTLIYQIIASMDAVQPSQCVTSSIYNKASVRCYVSFVQEGASFAWKSAILAVGFLDHYFSSASKGSHQCLVLLFAMHLRIIINVILLSTPLLIDMHCK